MILLDMQFQIVIEGQVYPTLLNEVEDVRRYAHELAQELGVARESVRYQWRAHVTASTEWVDLGSYPNWDALFTEVQEWDPPAGLRRIDRVSD